MNAREVALVAIRDVFPQNGGSERGAQEALDYRARKAGLEPRDRAFATELCYGTIKMRRALDWYLQPFIGERAATLPPVIREILRLAVFELVYTKPDEHATVFECVNLAKHHGHRGVANLVNGVLRSFLRDRPAAPVREDFEDDDDYLGTVHSLPTWLVRQWRLTFGNDAIDAICAGVNAPPASAITVNPLKSSADEMTARLREANIPVRPSPFAGDSLLVADAAYVRRNEPSDGSWWIQSESSAMAADIVNPQPGESILDVCSGRGNKALQLGARMENEGSLLCIEIDERKAATLEKRLEVGGVAAGVIVGDATQSLLRPEQRFDRILIDAPCSGTGIVGRHPESRWKKQPGDGERLARTQVAILDRIAPAVHEGGALVYAVCSTDPRETIEVVEWLRRHHNFERGLIPARYEPLITDDGDVRVPPGIDGRDGFFIARLERR